MKKYTLDELTDKYVGKKGTPDREQFEFELRLDILGDMIKKARKEKKMTQEQLGELVGVQKAQISKIENNTKDVRLSTIMKVFEWYRILSIMVSLWIPTVSISSDSSFRPESVCGRNVNRLGLLLLEAIILDKNGNLTS